jgi:nitrogen regulatory protein PII
MKMIWAVVRSSKVDEVAACLKSIGVSGCTVSRVRGYGDEWHVYEPLIHGGQHKLEMIVRNDQVDEVVKEITNHACTRLEGDGILAVFELQSVVEIRSKERVGAETSPNGLLSRTPSRFV